MKRRCYILVHSVVSLTIGLSCYLLFRRNTIIHKILNCQDLFGLSEKRFFADCQLRYYLPDFLWCYSLSMLLYAVWYPQNKIHLIPIFSAFFGIVWELLQLLSIVNGTFDLADCTIYILASAFSYYLFKREKSK